MKEMIVKKNKIKEWRELGEVALRHSAEKNECIGVKTVKFDDGMEVDLIVNVNRKTKSLWFQMAWYDECNRQIGRKAVRYKSMEGEWECHDRRYDVKVVVVDDEEKKGA